MVSVNMFMTQVMNNPIVFVGGLAAGYIIAKLQNKFGGGNDFGGGL
jgi:hypothetical protein